MMSLIKIRTFLRRYKALAILAFLVTAVSFLALRAGILRLTAGILHTQANSGFVREIENDYQPTPADGIFLQELRKYITHTETPDYGALIRTFKRTSFPKNAYGTILTAYQPGIPIIRGIATNRMATMDLLAAARALSTNPRSSLFSWSGPDACRIQIDFITSRPSSAPIKTLCEQCVSGNRFEPGVDGLLASYGKKKKYFLPGDAFRLSIYALKPAVDYVLKSMKDVPDGAITWARFRTHSFISYKNAWLKLYRGIPVVNSVRKEDLLRAIGLAIAHTVRHQQSDGKFLYYYDAAKNSFRDHEHPSRDPEADPYYNELRHCGGSLMLLQEYERTKAPELLEPIRRSVGFSVSLIREYQLPSGEKAGCYYYNKKAKLGGSGIALYLLAEYQRITGDTAFASYAKLLHRHLMAQILPTGEFMYYAIYLDKPVSPAENDEYFNFYYPGEAIVGLTQYVKCISKDEKEKAATLAGIKNAMHFLIEDRPKRYAKDFASLPSDSWLMMGVNELWDIPEARDESYAAFVFSDADKMATLMYKEKDALYPDYPGAFYYHYGDLPYADGARAEGLLAAAYLAKKKGEAQRLSTYLAACKLSAWALTRLVNTPEAMYFAKNQDLAVGGVRFKHTRQWFRIDTTAHVISFYLKFLPLWSE